MHAMGSTMTCRASAPPALTVAHVAAAKKILRNQARPRRIRLQSRFAPSLLTNFVLYPSKPLRSERSPSRRIVPTPAVESPAGVVRRPARRVMRFGFFDQLPCAGASSERQRYQDLMARIELGDALGFDTVWLGELHFSRAFSILADPLLVLAAAAQRTTRIRLGTAVTLLPLHNPVKIAEQAAVTDILSNGRLELGVGRGTAPVHYAGYDIPQEESRGRFEEALDFIIEAWTRQSFSYLGTYFRARDLTVVPK